MEKEQPEMKSFRRPILLLISLLSLPALLLHGGGQRDSGDIQKTVSVEDGEINSAIRETEGIPASPDFWSDLPDDILADELVNRMSDEELLAQILMFGWAGREPSPLVTDWVSRRSLGSVKVFGWNTDNITDVANSVRFLQEKAQQNRFRIPLFVATDQEGGWIRHVKGTTTDTPGNLAIGASGLPSDAYYSGYYIARELRVLGINMNFAPTVDLYTDPESTVIGPRSFGEDPDAAGILGASFAAGTMAAGVLPTAKHFPGHGDTGIDSHGGLPVIEIDEQTLNARELVPFRYLIKEKLPAIMSGHISFPNITEKGEPASLSAYFLRNILREQMGFEGLIITDDMMMNGATTYTGSFSSAVAFAIQAGNDIIISSTTPGLNDAVWRSNISLMQNDESFRTAVVNAARRVIYYKLVYLKRENAPPLFPDPADIAGRIPAPGGDAFFLEQACRSITLFREGELPVGEEEKVLLAGQFSDFFRYGRKRFPLAEMVRLSYQPRQGEADYAVRTITERARSCDTIIFCVTNRESLAILNRLRNLNKKVIVISVLSPVFILNLEWPDTIIAAYSYSPFSFQAAFGAIAGDFYPQGIFPLAGGLK
ncbi:MAG: glycoside hydrolase family 3 protein [Spirochaetaceae bacterium]|nr:glycoside hydrolase family 3 protein [Spirochaetaceae bacterium]